MSEIPDEFRIAPLRPFPLANPRRGNIDEPFDSVLSSARGVVSSGELLFPFKIASVSGEDRVTVYPGTANLLMPTVGATPLDDPTPPELTVVAGPVYVELHYRGATAISAEVKNAATLPANVDGVSPRYIQIGTVALDSGDAVVTAQIVKTNISVSFTTHPWRLTGYIEGGQARIQITPGTVNSFIPTIGIDSLVNVPAPYLVVSGTSGQVYLDAEVDGVGAIIDLDAAEAATVPADTATDKRKLVGTWTASAGVFTSMNSILNTNQTFRVCNGVAEWY